VKIEILYFDDCPNHELVDERVHEVLEELGVQADIVHVNVKDEATATRVRFPGSPTVRVNGEDVIPGHNGEPYSLRCRVYPTSAGFAGAPDKDAIRVAIQRSAA
jgi:hypothetical protein